MSPRPKRNKNDAPARCDSNPAFTRSRQNSTSPRGNFALRRGAKEASLADRQRQKRCLACAGRGLKRKEDVQQAERGLRALIIVGNVEPPATVLNGGVSVPWTLLL